MILHGPWISLPATGGARVASDEYAHCGNNFFLPDRGAWLALLSNRLTGNSAVGKDVVRHPSSAYGGRGEKFDADRVACAAVRGERFAPSRGRAIAAKVTPAERSVGVERVAAIRRQLASVRVADARHCWRRQDGLRREGAARSVAARRSVAGVREGRRKGLAAAFLLRRAARRACARGGARHGDRRPTEERDDEEKHRCCCEKLLLAHAFI